MSEVDNSIDAPSPEVAGAMLVRALKKAHWITFWERLWPPLAAVATASDCFSPSWADARLWLPPIAKQQKLNELKELRPRVLIPIDGEVRPIAAEQVLSMGTETDI